MGRYKITFSYDGSKFAGYQIQPNLRTVQGELEKAVSFINRKKKTIIHASGRTDALVHALGQVAHFDLDIEISTNKLKSALNSNLPDDIHVIEVEIVTNDFHSRYSVKTKEYEYAINLGEYNPLERNYVYQCCHNLNIDKIKNGLSFLKGKHDFRAFVSENSDKVNCVREIFTADIVKDIVDNNKYHIYFKGTGFMKYQIRNMVGTLIKIGENKMEPTEIVNIMNSKNREKAGRTAPACGLYLIKVNY